MRTTTTSNVANKARPHYPIDVSFEPMCAQESMLFTGMRFVSMPWELLLRRELGWVYLGQMFWVQVVLCAGVIWFLALPYLAAGYAPRSLLAWLAMAYLPRGAWMQYRIIARGRWGADYEVPGYSGGVSYVRLLLPMCGFTPKGSNAQERKAHSEELERSVRMFAEPIVVALMLLLSGLFFPVSRFWFVVPIAMFFKQAWEWQFTRARVQSAITKKLEVDAFQEITHGNTGPQLSEEEEEIPVATVAPLPYCGELFSFEKLQARMPERLQTLMQGTPSNPQ